MFSMNNSQIRKSIPLIIIASLFIFIYGYGQNTNSPYSMFGPGELQQKGFGKNIAMGGTGIGMPSTNFINNINPASYSGFDSLRFIYELGGEYKYSQLESQGNKRIDKTFNFKYVTVGFRVCDWLATSWGVTPFSNVGYSIVTSSYAEGTSSKFYSYYEGSGGINQVYSGNAIKIDNLSIGVHVAYLFGSIIQDETVIQPDDIFSSFVMDRTHYLNSFFCDFGAQYSFKRKKWNYTLGAIYNPEQHLRSTYKVNVETTSYTTVSSYSEKADDLIVPAKYGIGLSAKKGPFVQLTTDYEFQKWDGIRYLMRKGNFKNSHRIAIGAELRPWGDNIITRDWYKKIIYRIGANYRSSFLNIQGKQIQKFGVTAGLGIPVKNLGTLINFSCEAATEGTGAEGLIRENYLLFHLNFSINEAWFKKKIFF